jgi:hypothetical protein
MSFYGNIIKYFVNAFNKFNFKNVDNSTINFDADKIEDTLTFEANEDSKGNYIEFL